MLPMRHNFGALRMQSASDVRNCFVGHCVSPLLDRNWALWSVKCLRLRQAFHTTRLLCSPHQLHEGTIVGDPPNNGGDLLCTLKAEKEALRSQIDTLITLHLATQAINRGKPRPRGVSRKEFDQICNKGRLKMTSKKTYAKSDRA